MVQDSLWAVRAGRTSFKKLLTLEIRWCLHIITLAVEADLCDGGAYQLLWGLVMFLSSFHLHWYCYRIHW